MRILSRNWRIALQPKSTERNSELDDTANEILKATERIYHERNCDERKPTSKKGYIKYPSAPLQLWRIYM